VRRNLEWVGLQSVVKVGCDVVVKTTERKERLRVSPGTVGCGTESIAPRFPSKECMCNQRVCIRLTDKRVVPMITVVDLEIETAQT
jgi:hypothetical protein